MAKSHVLINCEKGTEEILTSEIMKIEDVKSIDKTMGYYDLVVELESKNEEHLKKIIGNKIRNLKLVRSALMLIHA